MDIRGVLEYEVGYTGLAGTCSFCAAGADSKHRSVRDDVTVTKHRWANRPLGQLIVRCPEHQRWYEESVTFALDASYHAQRTARRMEDPVFRAEYERTIGGGAS